MTAIADSAPDRLIRWHYLAYRNLLFIGSYH
jgi:hypothetical protein